MDPTVFAAMIASAFLHASWNAWVKSRRDNNNSIAALVIGAGFPNVAVIVVLGWPAAPAWPWIACTVALSVASLTLLSSAYREGDFAVAFPMIRGLIPVVLVLAAAPLFGERPTLTGVAGVLAVSAGLVVIGWEAARRTRTMTAKGLAFILLAAGITATAAMTDAKGARLGGHPLAYAATIAVLNALAMACLQTARGRHVGRILVSEWPVTLFAAALSIVSYQLYVWLLQRAAVALVAAMRETSMLFALGIAVVMLRERVSGLRWVAVMFMLAGVALMRV